MCGVTGIFHVDGRGASESAIKRMTDTVAHRGPDGDGIFVDRFVALGHRRLAIIDLSDAAAQPMATADGRFVISYNGELYNFPKLRSELESLGYAFRSRSDTEVVLAAFELWGRKALERFNGMFAFAIWDRRECSLTLARDRYGIKPLYWAFRSGALIFASEAKAIGASGLLSLELDASGLVEYMTFQNFFSTRTLAKSVNIVPAGTSMTFKLGDTTAPSPNRYWDYHFSSDETGAQDDDRAYVEELDRLFRQAVSRQLISDVEVGAYLSGGMDSGSIAAVAAKQLPSMRTFTCGFDLTSASGVELSFDERAAAERMSYLFQTEHYEVVLKAGDMQRVLPKLAWHLDEPRVGQCYPNFYVANLASKFVKVVLSGVGGDELFGGYPWRYYRSVGAENFAAYINSYYDYWQRLVPDGQMSRLLAPVWSEAKHVDTRQVFTDVFSDHASLLDRPDDFVNHSLYFEAKTFLHGLLVIEDKVSMAHGLETRVPFLDNDLVDFAMRVPTRLKLRNVTQNVRINENEIGSKKAKYYQRTSDGKLLLREMMARHIPQEIAQREKQGFSAPDASWFKGESIDYVRDTLFNPGAHIYRYFDRAVTEDLIEEHLQGRENRRLLIWSLLNIEEWCRQHGPK